MALVHSEKSESIVVVAGLDVENDVSVHSTYKDLQCFGAPCITK